MITGMRYRVSDVETVASPGEPRPMSRNERDARLRWVTSTWLASLPTAGSRAAHERELRRFLAWCATAGVVPLDATRTHATAYLAGARGPDAALLAPSTQERRRARLHSFFRAAVAAGAARESPFTRG